jgi:hypothetical protein
MSEQPSMSVKDVGYEQAIIQVLRGLPVERMAQLLDFALFLKMQPTAVTPPTIIEEVEPLDERIWGQASVQSLSKYWDTPEEDAAWEHLQKAM